MGDLFNAFGITNSGVTTNTLAPQSRTPNSEQIRTTNWDKDSAVDDPNVWQYYSNRMTMPRSLDEMMRLWDEMCNWDLMAAALVEIVDETIQQDQGTGKAIWYECSDEKIEEELNNMLETVDAEDKLPSQIWHLAGYGNHFEKILYQKGEGVQGLAYCHPMDVRRYWLSKNRKCVGFKWGKEKPDKSSVWQQGNVQIERAALNHNPTSSTANLEELWYPWDFCFTGDTKISLLDGRELSLEQIQREVGEGEFWVYSVTPEGRVVPGKAHSLKLTRTAADVVEVELDNGEKIKCTPDHRFMLRDGTYREAGSLVPGDSLMPLYRKISTDEEHGREGYELFLDNISKRWRFTHWRVAEAVHGTRRCKKGQFEESYHVHHKSFDKRNNDPRQLEWLTVEEHNKVHTDLNSDPVWLAHCRPARSASLKKTWETRREYMTAAVKRAASTPERRALSHDNAVALRERRKTDPELDQKVRNACKKNGALLHSRQETDPEFAAKMREINSQNGTKARTALNERLKTDPELRQKWAKMHRQGTAAWQERRKADPELDQRIKEAQRQNGKKQAAALNERRKNDPEFDIKFRSAISQGRLNSAKCRNHKVVAVRAAGAADVYDFEVDGQHNFALSAGVFVHNCHFRRSYRLRVSEHGEPIFEEAQGIYKKLRMAIDQMVVHRAQVQPDRYVIGIDTQEQPPLEQLKTVQRWKQSLRSKQAYGPGGSTDSLGAPTEFSSYYNPLALDTMFWLPKPKGFQHSIDKLVGTPNVPDVFDIELLLNLFFSIIGMPRSWLGGQNGEQSGGPVSGKALLAQDIRFMRKVRSLRRPVLNGYTWLAYFHLIVKGVDVSSVDIRAKMSDIGTLEDQLKSEIFQTQVELLTKLGDFFDKYKMSPDAWLELIFKKFMHLPDELVNTVLTALPAPVAMEGREPAPAQHIMLRRLDEHLRPHRKLVEHLKRLSRVLYEEAEPTGIQMFKRQGQQTPRGATRSNYLTETLSGASTGNIICEMAPQTLTPPPKSSEITESTPPMVGTPNPVVRSYYGTGR